MIELRAPAKLTLDLAVTGIRGDGMHLIVAEMVTLDLADTLIVDSDGDGVEFVGVEIGDVTDSLVHGALRLAGRRASVRVHKRVPAGAGLGGGSADAAAILRWAGFTDLDAAARLGADIAFCLVGGRARVTGIGEVVTPLPFVPQTYTLLTPPFGCPTPEVYRAWDSLGGPSGDHGNDLEPAALAVAPELARFRDLLGDLSGQPPRLAGSGSTWFVEGAYESATTVIARTVPPGWTGST